MGLGHICNIHFPFNIEADTAIGVASEMVEELKLSNQDVTNIAEMIDFELQNHFSVWNPSERSIQSTTFTGSLSSGRKFWSDSPKAMVKNSFFRPNASSNLTQHEEAKNCVHDGDDWSLGKKSSGVDDFTCIGRRIPSKVTIVTEGESPKVAKSSILGDSESENVNLITTKLKNLLVTQQEELKKLKKKHALAVSDFLRKLPYEVRHAVLNEHNLDLPDSIDADRFEGSSSA